MEIFGTDEKHFHVSFYVRERIYICNVCMFEKFLQSGMFDTVSVLQLHIIISGVVRHHTRVTYVCIS